MCDFRLYRRLSVRIELTYCQLARSADDRGRKRPKCHTECI